MSKKKPAEKEIKVLAKTSMDIGSTGGMGSVRVSIRKITEEGTSRIQIIQEVVSLGSSGKTVIETNDKGLIELAAIFRIASHAVKKGDYSSDYVALPEK